MLFSDTNLNTTYGILLNVLQDVIKFLEARTKIEVIRSGNIYKQRENPYYNIVFFLQHVDFKLTQHWLNSSDSSLTSESNLRKT